MPEACPRWRDTSKPTRPLTKNGGLAGVPSGVGGACREHAARGSPPRSNRPTVQSPRDLAPLGHDHHAIENVRGPACPCRARWQAEIVIATHHSHRNPLGSRHTGAGSASAPGVAIATEPSGASWSWPRILRSSPTKRRHRPGNRRREMLLDTHACCGSSPMIPSFRLAEALIDDPANTVLVSAASAWRSARRYASAGCRPAKHSATTSAVTCSAIISPATHLSGARPVAGRLAGTTKIPRSQAGGAGFQAAQAWAAQALVEGVPL
jgi:hypothetical protein